MKDLYKKFGLRPLINNRDLIDEEINKTQGPDRDLGHYVLLHPGRKKVYDRTYRNVNIIGQLRSRLNLTHTDHWNKYQYSDFVSEWQEADAGSGWGSAQTKTETNKARRPSSANYYDSSREHNKYEGMDRFFKAAGLMVSIFLLLVWVLDETPTDNLKKSPPRDIFVDDRTTSKTPVVDYKVPMHVTAQALNLRKQPSTSAPIVDTLKKYQDVYVSEQEKKGSSPWVFVLSDSGEEGYVSRKYLASGYGSSAQIAECRAGITRPHNGYVIQQASTGIHHLEVTNDPGSDAVVRLKDKAKQIVLEFYVRSGRTAKITNVPEGDYQFYFAMGEDYSASCDRFLKDMRASKDPNFTPYKTKYRDGGMVYVISKYTLKKVPHGNFTPRSVPLSDF